MKATIVGMVCALTTQALAVNDRTITYRIHKTPTDPASALVFKAEFELTVLEVEEDVTGPGGTVRWEVSRATLTEVLSNGPNRVWIETLPDVDTTDGSWTIYYPDLADISAADFADPPLISGVAGVSGHGGKDLTYDLEGNGASGTSPYPVTGWETWSFLENGESTAITEGSNEPVDIDEEEDLS